MLFELAQRPFSADSKAFSGFRVVIDFDPRIDSRQIFLSAFADDDCHRAFRA
jgi:hypothetical protein